MPPIKMNMEDNVVSPNQQASQTVVLNLYERHTRYGHACVDETYAHKEPEPTYKGD